MNRRPRSTTVRTLVLVCLVGTLVTGGAVAAASAAPAPSTQSASVTTTAAATHSFVLFNVSEARTDPGGVVAMRVTFHNAYGARFRVTGPDGFRYAADIGPTGGVQLTARFDTDAAGRGSTTALSVADGSAGNVSVEGAPGDALPAGVYTVSVYAAGAVQDSIPLYVGDATGSSPTPSGSVNATAAATTTARTDSASSDAAAPGFGILVSTLALAAVTVAAGVVGRRGRRRS